MIKFISFQDLEIQAVLLDEILRDPESPSQGKSKFEESLTNINVLSFSNFKCLKGEKSLLVYHWKWKFEGSLL